MSKKAAGNSDRVCDKLHDEISNVGMQGIHGGVTDAAANASNGMEFINEIFMSSAGKGDPPGSQANEK